MQAALISLINDIQDSGGLITYTDGFSAPAASPSWTDLGSTVLAAHKALEDEGVEIRLYVEESDLASSDVDD